MLEFTEEVSSLEGSASQMTIEKLLPLGSLEPGKYILKLKVTDRLKKESLTQQDQFSIT